MYPVIIEMAALGPPDNYIILEETQYPVLEDKVNDLLKENYTLVGGVCKDGDQYLQAMVLLGKNHAGGSRKSSKTKRRRSKK